MTMFDFKFHINDDAHIASLALHYECNANTMQEVKLFVEGIISFMHNKDVYLFQLDLAEAEFVDSGGIGLCLSLYKKLKREEIKFQIINVNPSIYKVLKSVSLEDILKVSEKDWWFWFHS